MSYRGTEVPFNDFSGGMASNISVTQLENNQALAVDNIIVFPKGRGFRSRLGNTEFNSSAMVSSSTAVTGLGYYKQADQDEWLLAIAGTKIYKSEFDGTMDDITNTVTITSGQDNIWTFATFNDNVVAFGGSPTSPNAPITWTGSGNAAALAGSPPSAYGCFQANNRMFAFRTSSRPSAIFWSILGNEADWTGTGSGSAEVWESDNDRLTAAAVLNTNTVLLFKENSIHQMQIGELVSSAFPIFPLFKGTGCAGKHACVVANGAAYFITSQGKMRITDGTRIVTEKDLPALANIDDLWNAIPTSRLPYIQGVRKTGVDYDHIIWTVAYGSGQSTNNVAFIWDLVNQCWLRNTTGFKANVLMTTQAGVLYTGHYNGKIYKQEVASTVTDASESSTLIDGYWSSDWISQGKLESIKQPRKMNVSFASQSGGNIRISYGFDFSGLATSDTINQTYLASVYDTGVYGVSTYAGDAYNIQPLRLKGRGNVFRYRIRTPTESYPMRIHGFTLSGKDAGQKEIAAR